MSDPLSSSVFPVERNVRFRQRSRVIWEWLRSRPGWPIVQTRGIVALVAFLLAASTSLLGPARVLIYIALYLALIITGAAILGNKIAHKFWRAGPEFIDVVLISAVVYETGAIGSPWFLLYLFPVMSVSRYLGRRGSIGMAVIATIAYGAVVAGHYFPVGSTVFAIRVVILLGAAFTAASLTRQRDEDASLLKAIGKIDHQILTNADVPQLMRSVLQSAMEVTGSQISAMAFIEDGQVSGNDIYTEAIGDEDKERARDLIQKHASSLMMAEKRDGGLALPERRLVVAALVRLWRKDDPDFWTGRLVLLTVDNRVVGILGVFSRRLVHYTGNDVKRLRSMAPLVELARKHAKVFADLKAREQESKQRLRLLYDIGEHLATERGLDTLFKNVVRLISTQLRSEEAALFTPASDGKSIVKRAVWASDKATREQLEQLETSYRPGENSLTRRVFDGTDLYRSNVIADDEVHAKEYQAVLPSHQTRDYLGAQLRIGPEVLGVIRVLNKKAKDYTVGNGALADEGFDREDHNLLEMIATQVAAAIRSANFIEKQRYFQDVIYKSPDPIMVLDGHGRIRYFNKKAEKIWNRSEEEVRNESVISFYSSEAEARRVGKALENAEDHTISDFMTEIRVGEDVIPVRLSASLLLEDGELVGSIGLFQEQTGRIRKAEEEQLAALAQMARSLGHAIKNDLGAINNHLAGLKRKAAGDSQILNYYSSIRQLADSIRAKLRSMLSAAKPEPLPRKTLLSFTDFLREFEANVSQEATDAEIAFSLTLPHSDVFVLGDSSKLHEVLINLFVNSVDAIKSVRQNGRPSAGRITVDTTIDPGTSSIRIEWRDDGVGMSAETVRKAFAPYYTTKHTGTGLGLFHSRRTIENHGGSISVRSTEGVGTLFRITLPLPQEHTTEEATTS